MQKISKLKNGIRVITERIDYVKSVSVGVWVGAGSVMENEENNGVSHFIEHMFFKGTKTRSAKDIAEFMDRVGGQLNAVTAKEYTCYYAKTLTEHADMSFEILSDMVINSVFSREMMETERKVIAEEISMCEDNPEDVVHDRLSRLIWRESPLGYPIAGTEKSLNGITREAMLSYYENFYCGENIVISVVGNFDESKVLEKLEEKFAGIKPKLGCKPEQQKIDMRRDGIVIKKDIEQCHICMGLEGLPRNDKDIYALMVVNAMFGGNMSSRLFQKVREEKGLAYSIYSYMNDYKNNGSLVICAGVNPDKVCEAVELINEEIKELKREKISREKVETVKEQMKASIIMGMESMSSRMATYGKNVLFDNRIKTPESITEDVEKVSYDSAAEVIDRVFDINKLNIAVLGKINGDGREILETMNF